MMLRLSLRRARRDLGVLLVWIALVAFAVALAIGQPRLLQTTVDAGARQAVTSAGSDTDVVVSATVTRHGDYATAPVAPSEIEGLAADIPHNLPPALRSVYSRSVLTVVGPATQLNSIDGAQPQSTHPVSVQIALLDAHNSPSLAVASGVLPSGASSSSEIDVAVPAAAAKASGLASGSVFEVPTDEVTANSGSDHLTLRVAAIVKEKSAPEWVGIPNLWTTTTPRASTDPIDITVLTDEAGVARAAAGYSEPFKASLRLSLDPSRFTADREAAVAAELVALSGHADRLAGSTGADLGVTSDYGTALADFPAKERAAIAQISVMAAGVLGVAAAVLLLVSRMLVARREGDIALERARGASLASIALRALFETFIAGLIGTAVGVAAVQLLYPGALAQPTLLVFVLVVALLAVPVQSVLSARRSWTGRRVAANRSDRLDAERRLRARRIAIEITVIALAAAALVSLAARGLLETQTGGVDLLLASAPLLLAASVTIVVLRVYRFPLGLGIAAGRRSIGALGILAAVRAQRAIALLPLLALTLSVALAVGGGLLASTVAAGQETASWQRIGADVRARTSIADTDEAAAASAPGVTAAAAIGVQTGVQLRLTGSTDFATMVSVDPRFAGQVAGVPGAASASGVDALRKLSARPTSGGGLSVVVNSDYANEVGAKGLGMYVGVKFIPLNVIAVTDEKPSGFLAAPFIFVDRTALAAQLGQAVHPNILLVNGPGANAAVTQLGIPSIDVVTRATWLSERRGLALVSGVDQGIQLATIATALLAILALVVTLLSGARERGRSLALIRTLGLPARLGWWLALAELAPVLVAALVGGIVAGVGIVVFLEPTLGLRELAGGLSNPAPSISAALVLGMAGTAVGLLLLAVLIEIGVRRRDRLSEVLRVGETT